MISIVRSRVAKVVTLAAAALTLVLGLGVQPAAASTSQVCGNGGSGYCLNDWGGAGATGDAIKMYYGGTRNDDFYVQEVNRCGGHDHVTSNCPFASLNLDTAYYGDAIVQITYTNNSVECVGTDPTYGHAQLEPCADPLSGGGGGNGVIMVYSPSSCGGTLFVDRYWSDVFGASSYLISGGNPGVQAGFEGPIFGPPITCWGGFQLFGP